jgi:rhamnose transport system permease protein
VFTGFSWSLRYTAAGRLLYLVGSNAEAARLAGVDVRRVKIAAFACLGALTALAAILNSVRFGQIPPNAGLGLEMKVIAAVVVGGTAITGGRGTLAGTLLGVVLLGAIGPALTYLGVSAYWERAIQGAIILVAVGVNVVPSRVRQTGQAPSAARA